MQTDSSEEQYHAWNPGLVSALPSHLIPQQSLFRSNSIDNTYTDIKELSDFSGMSEYLIADFKLERLILHEALVWVTSNLCVPDGPRYEDLGLNMRAMVTELQNHCAGEAYDIKLFWQEINTRAEAVIKAEIAQLGDNRNQKTENKSRATPNWRRLTTLLGGFYRKDTEVNHESNNRSSTTKLTTSTTGFDTRCIDCLKSVVQRIEATRGSSVFDENIMLKLAMIRFRQSEGYKRLRKFLHPLLLSACKKHNYQLLPPQTEPCVLNIKGASASGKSTLRPLQRKLSDHLNLNWNDFAVISPDYWRKQLLDYGGLGEDYKYAGSLTGQELTIVDKKLDEYMANKAAKGKMSHLLIDRFRFDSFSSIEEREIGAKLLTRFGQSIYLFFVVTSPHLTVERAWIRGAETGRYKSVDDLLYHNIEAFEGMPDLFFSWISATDKKVHVEFLDNDVDKGDIPLTIASGWQDDFTVYDIAGMQNIEAFKHIDINARRPENVYHSTEAYADDRWAFINRCIDGIQQVSFVNPKTGRCYGITQQSKWTFLNTQEAPTDTCTQLFLSQVDQSELAIQQQSTANHHDFKDHERRIEIGSVR